ncbi:MAG: vWA domain-containing protein [Myxococcota bacterium]
MARAHTILIALLLTACAPPDRDSVFDTVAGSEGADTSAGMPGQGSAGDSGATPDPAGTSGGEATTSAPELDGTDAGPKFDTPVEDTDTVGGRYCGNDLDIVFVMDVSTSMGGFFDRLEASILEVDAAIAELDLPSEAQYGLVVFVDDVLVVAGGAPYAELAVLQADFATWNAFTSNNQQIAAPGMNGTMPENSLDALHAAASEFQWRAMDTTDRIVIHTTDDTFWDGPLTQYDGIMVQHGYEETVDALRDQQIRVFSFATSAGCGTVIDGQCADAEVGEGWFAPYQGEPAIPEATDGAVWEIAEVNEGTLSLADAIPSAVEESYCVPYPPEG